MRAFLLSVLALAGCTDAAEAPVSSAGVTTGPTSLAPVEFTFVNASGVRTDALDVPAGARALAVGLGVALRIGSVGDLLADPDGDEAPAAGT